MKTLLNLIYYVPVIGWMIKSAINGGTSEKVFFILNLMMLWILAVIFFGYVAMIVPALVAAFTILGLLVALTASDLKVE